MKLVVTIMPSWSCKAHKVELELDSADFEDYTPEELEPYLTELAKDTACNEVSYDWEVVDD